MERTLQLLQENPRDPIALMSLYGNYDTEFREIAIRYFGSGQVADKVTLSLLVIVASRVWTWDPSTDPDRWIVQCGDSEASRLRAALDTTKMVMEISNDRTV